MRKVVWVASAVALLALWCRGDDGGRHGLRLATFNIENFPHSEGQVRGAFQVLDELDVEAVGVQEITDPEVFRRGMRRFLGETWRAVFCDDCGMHRVGVAYDSDRLELLSTNTHEDTRVYPGAKPAFEARLERRDTGTVVRLIVVHLKAGGGHFATRERQLRALRPLLSAAVASGELTVLLGDYNATSDDDRDAIAALAGHSGAVWASRQVPCTSYWNRSDGCPGTPLDHVLTSEPASVAARGPCEAIGCDPGDRCPVFHREVSDHCPVTVDLP